MTDKPTSNLAVLIFEGQDTAQVLYEQIEQMQKEKLVSVEDAIILEYESGGTQIHVGTSDAGRFPVCLNPGFHRKRVEGDSQTDARQER
jgi:hypothetical protein